MRLLAVLILAAASLAAQSTLAGRWTGYVGGNLHTWQFQQDGTFLHVWVAPGAGPSLLRQERGNFRIDGEALELSAVVATAGIVAPGHEGKKTLMGGVQSKPSETRRLKLKVLEPGKAILVDGARLMLA